MKVGEHLLCLCLMLFLTGMSSQSYGGRKSKVSKKAQISENKLCKSKYSRQNMFPSHIYVSTLGFMTKKSKSGGGVKR